MTLTRGQPACQANVRARAPRHAPALCHRRAPVSARASAASAASPPPPQQQQQAAATMGAREAEAFAGFEAYVLDLQERILGEAERLDGSGKTFVRDRWSRGSDNAGVCGARGGGGRWPCLGALAALVTAAGHKQ
jgi:hypothetical protein